MRAITPRAAAIAVVAALVLGAGLGWAGATDPASENTRGVVAFVGDSNIVYGARALTDATTSLDEAHRLSSYLPVMLGRSGASIRTSDCGSEPTCASYDYWQWKLAALQDAVAPDVYVVNLGINDTWYDGNLGTPGSVGFGKKIDWFMALTQGKPVLWTNLPCILEPVDNQAACFKVNYFLFQAQKRWPTLTVLNWSGVASSHPEWMGWTVHYSATGYAAYAAFVTAELDRRFP